MSSQLLSKIFTIKYQSFDNHYPIFLERPTNVTVMTLVPRENATIQYPFELVSLIPLDDLDLPFTMQPITDSFTFGSRFTTDTFSTPSNPLFDPSKVITPTYPLISYQSFTQRSIVRDVNAQITSGLYGQNSIFAFKVNVYKYLNGTEETFYETNAISGVSEPLKTNNTWLRYRLAGSTVQVYQETKRITFFQVLGIIMSGFQTLLVTTLLIVFGRGKYSPYGLIHKIFPDETVKAYKPVGDPVYDAFRYLLTSYLDTSILESKNAPKKQFDDTISMKSLKRIFSKKDGQREENVKAYANVELGREVDLEEEEAQKKRKWRILTKLLGKILLGVCLVALALPMMGGGFISSVYFMKIEDVKLVSNSWFTLSLWGPCSHSGDTVVNCRPVLWSSMFDNFDIMPQKSDVGNSYMHIELAVRSRCFPLGFILLLMAWTLFSTLLALKIAIIVPVDIIVESAYVALPGMAGLGAAFGIVSLIMITIHYSNISQALTPTGPIVKTTLGNAFYITTLGVISGISLTLIEIKHAFEMRRKQIENQHKRRSFLNPISVIENSRSMYEGSIYANSRPSSPTDYRQPISPFLFPREFYGTGHGMLSNDRSRSRNSRTESFNSFAPPPPPALTDERRDEISSSSTTVRWTPRTTA
ncbi:hypothetical protein HK098_001180 [Nowakowskiella sp. JEL0407]|nr:hypothetical protein HK098_001180 [Nowakowskiella sp. JEL0407]